MPGLLRMLASRAVWAGVAGLAIAAPAAAQPPDDPIAASNQLVDPWMAPSVRKTAVEAPWLVQAPEPQPVWANPPDKRALARISAPTQTVPQAMPAEPVMWSAPDRRAITSAMPIPTRPMIPCEPVFVAAGGRHTAPDSLLAQNRGTDRDSLPAHLGSPTPPQPDYDAPPRAVTTIRFLDDSTPPKPEAEAETLIAVIRRGGAATGTAADIRAAVERACRGKTVACQTEVAGERQVRVLVIVHSAEEWQRLYERLEHLPQLGEYGLLFQVRMEK